MARSTRVEQLSPSGLSSSPFPFFFLSSTPVPSAADQTLRCFLPRGECGGREFPQGAEKKWRIRSSRTSPMFSRT
jgi:hypothetical protein